MESLNNQSRLEKIYGRIITLEEIHEQNYNRRKEDLKCVLYFKTYSDKTNYLDFDFSNILPDEFRDNLEQLMKIQSDPNTRIPWASSNPEDWYPNWVVETISWVLSGVMHASSLGMGAILSKVNRRDLLQIMADSGDKRAQNRKIRGKLPKKLIGQSLEWNKITEDRWEVTIVPKQTRCKYDELAEEFWGSKVE